MTLHKNIEMLDSRISQSISIEVPEAYRSPEAFTDFVASINVKSQGDIFSSVNRICIKENESIPFTFIRSDDNSMMFIILDFSHPAPEGHDTYDGYMGIPSDSYLGIKITHKS